MNLTNKMFLMDNVKQKFLEYGTRKFTSEFQKYLQKYKKQKTRKGKNKISRKKIARTMKLTKNIPDQIFKKKKQHKNQKQIRLVGTRIKLC